MLAAIDVGSNTVRMLIGEVVDGKVTPRHYERRITRLKGGQSESGLAHDAMERTLSALQDFATLASGFDPVEMRIVGTEALRSAANGGQFAESVFQSLGVTLEIISGEQEAGLSASGVLSVIDPLPDHSVIIDIGGGSTEFILSGPDGILFSTSSPLGAVRLAEMPLKQQAVFIDKQAGIIKQQLETNQFLELCRSPSTPIVGTAGTITTIAAIEMKMAEYDWRRVNNYPISADRIHHLLEKLTPLAPAEREAVPGMEKGRGDLIVPGIEILQSLMALTGKNSLIISDFGLLEGLLIETSKTAAIH